MARVQVARHALAAVLVTGLTLIGATAAGAGAAGAAAGRPAPARTTTDAPAHASTSLAAVTAAPTTARLAHVVALGALQASTELSGEVALRLRDQSGLGSFIAQASDQRSPAYHHYLTPATFDAQYGPAPATVAAVESTLRGDGLQVSGVSSNGLLVDFSAPAATVERAFHTGIEQYRLADGSLGYGTTGAVEVPAAIAGSVTAVVGLDDLVHLGNHLLRDPRATAGRPVAHAALPAAIAGAPTACAGATSQEAYGAITDDQVASSYGADGLYAAGDLGAGETVDIFELEPFFTSDIQAFDECYFGVDHTAQLSVDQVDGGTGTGEGSGEATLDVEDVSAVAPDADIHVYEGPNSTIGSLDVYNEMVSTDDAHVISTSWGLCETALQAGSPGTEQIENSIFMEAAAQGQSVFAAAGDDGSDDCANQGPTPVAQFLSIDDPGSQPYVVSVGGTSFLDTAQPPDETVWNDGASGGAGGGGVSETWPMPSWQEDTAVPGVTDNRYITDSPAAGVYPYQSCSDDPGGAATDQRPAGSPSAFPAGTLCREVPDVTALADEYTPITVYYSGWNAFGGTSSSAPLWAAMTTDIDASSYCSGSADGAGFISPSLYAVAADPTTYAEAFDDITAGDNDSVDVGTDLPLGAAGNTYAAGTGYDLASGLGSPRLTNADGAPGLAQLVCGDVTAAARPVVTGISPAYGTAAGGTPVTITGRDFGATKGAVDFGDTAVPSADITSWSCSAGTCSVQLGTPAFVQPPATDGPPGGVADVTVQPAVASVDASAPSPATAFHYLAAPDGTDPVVEYISPAAGPDAGGTTVHLIGSGFEDGTVTSVTFGGSPGSAVDVLSDTELTVTTPEDTSATCSASSSDSTTGACQTEVVVHMSTTGGAVASPTSTILAAYTGAVTISPQLVFQAPAGCNCEAVPAATEFDYSPPPTITSISPAFGSANGGTVETIDGTGLNYLTYEWTDFGDPTSNNSQDLDLDAIEPGSVQVTGPFGPPSTEPQPTPVTLLTFAGSADNSPSTPFSFAGVPTVDSLSASYGPTIGGQSLTITGAGFSDATSVEIVAREGNFAGVPQSVVYLPSPPASDTTLTITTPAGVAGPSDVVVCSITGCSQGGTSATFYQYAYPGQPIVTSSSPSAGPAHGGTVVTLQGELLSSLRAVYFGNQLASSWASGPSLDPQGSSTEVTAVAPPGSPGTPVDIHVLTGGSSSLSTVTPAATFQYQLSAPSAPLGVQLHPGGASAVLSWQPPAQDGGDPVTGYVATATSMGVPAVTTTLAATTRSVTFPLLQPGLAWTFSVRATSAAGSSVPAVTPATPLAAGDNGYLVATANGAVLGFGSLSSSGGQGGITLPAPVAGIAAADDGLGYFELLTNGSVERLGVVSSFGSASLPAGTRAVGIAATPDGRGYWVVTDTGAVYAFGDAHYRGGDGAGVTNVVGIARTPDGLGYYLAQADGTVTAFGDAALRGDMAGKGLAAPIVGVAVNPVDGGYWLVGADGGVFAFANAGFHGSMIGRHLNGAAVGLAPTPDGLGYWIVGADNGVFTFGSAHYEGNPIGLAQSDAVGMVAA